MKIYDSWDVKYKNPFGAIKTGDTATFSLRIPKDCKPESPPVMIIFRAGFKERFLVMSDETEEEDCIVYTCAYSARYSGVCYYYFSLMIGDTRRYIKRTRRSEGTIGDGGLFQLTVYDKDYTTPDFIKGGVIYQIFPDRFAKSGKVHENIPYGRVMRDDWGGVPYYRPDENGHVWNNDYFGGDLEGIRQKLPYLHYLGITCIYLNPIFEAHENHRYNTANYMKVDPLLGTNEDFAELCRDAEQYDIKIILDGVFSHTGADSIYFNKFGRYGDTGAFRSRSSEYYPWYSFREYPTNYEAWWGIDTLPNVNETNSCYTEYICGENGVLHYWLSHGAAGFRLDVADELPDEFLDKLRDSVKSFGEDKLIIGEVWEDATNKESYGVKRRYLLGEQLDSVMNYPFRDAILSYVKGGSVHDFYNSIMTIMENYPKPSIDTLMNFISTHDVERAINNIAGEPLNEKSKEWQANYYLSSNQYVRGKVHLELAMVLQFFLPGVPSVYYGDEAGMQGCKDPFNRKCFPWGYEDKELVEYVAELSKIRTSNELFKDGTLRFLILDEDVLCFARARVDERKAVAVFLNRSGAEQQVKPNSNYEYKKYEIVKVNTDREGLLKMSP